jgi:16S rRNA (uracil1498-N3)-methyltransferase
LDGKRIAVVVGSEGGFSEEEAERLRVLAGGSVTLGKRILRADTACAAVVSVLMYELGEWSR